jgi:hypothetical protein
MPLSLFGNKFFFIFLEEFARGSPVEFESMIKSLGSSRSFAQGFIRCNGKIDLLMILFGKRSRFCWRIVLPAAAQGFVKGNEVGGNGAGALHQGVFGNVE